MQHYYLTANSNPVGEKQKLERADGLSEYGELHARYHSFFRSFIEKFGYYDLFLIDPEGNIVYSVFKETDYATNLETGPYRTSNLAKAAAIPKDSRGREFVQLVDFEPYRPSYNAPAAFIATPIYRDTEFVGVLALQLPVDNINSIDKVKTVGNCYVAACGLSNPYLDGGKRAIDFALSLQSIAFRFNHEKEIDLELKIGIHHGDVIAGIIGQERFLYDIWGDTATVAKKLMVDAEPGSILVSQSIFDRLHDLYEFESMGRMRIQGRDSIAAWQYRGAIAKQKKAITVSSQTSGTSRI